jgi:hypothetical protein
MNQPQFNLTSAVGRFVERSYSHERAKQFLEEIRNENNWAARFFLGDIGYLIEANWNQKVFDDSRGKKQNYPMIDDVDFKSEAPNTAERYLENQQLASPVVAGFIAVALLDSELYPLAREFKDPLLTLVKNSSPKVAQGVIGLGSRGGRLIAWIINLVILGSGFWLATGNYFWLGWILIAYGAYSLIIVTVQSIRVRRGLHVFGNQLQAIHRALKLDRDEIASGAFDPPSMITRLKQQESNGAYIPSLVYPLLSSM